MSRKKLQHAFGFLMLLGCIALANAQSTSQLRLGKSILLPGVRGRIDHMAFDLAHKRLFVASLGNNSVEAVDIKSSKVVGTIKGLAEPQGLLYQAETQQLWVANGGDGSVRIFDARTYRQLRSISLGDDADNIRRDASTGRVLVGYGSGAIAIFSAAGSKIADIKLDAHPESCQLEKSGTRMFVNLPHSHKVAVINLATSTLIGDFKTGNAQSNFPMALDEGDGRLFIVCRNPAVLLVMDTRSGAVVAELPTVGDSDDAFYNSAQKRLYVSGGEGAIAVYEQQDRDHYREIAREATVSGSRTSLLVPELGLLLVASREQGSSPAAIRVFETKN